MDPTNPLPIVDAQYPYSYVVTILQLIMTLCTLAGTIWVGVYSAWKEARNRRWAKEDKEERERNTQVIEALKEKTETVEKEVKEGNQKIEKQIEENTELSKKAFSEANNFNKKINRLEKQIGDARSSKKLTDEEVAALKKRLRDEDFLSGKPLLPGQKGPEMSLGEDSTDSDTSFLPKDTTDGPKP